MVADIDYVKSNFEFPVLTKITGQPIYTLLKKIKDELMANAASVTCELGGGLNGHLGLVLTPLEYTNVNVTPYNKPIHPGTLVIPGGNLPNYQRQEMRDDHKEAIRLAREADNVERALKKQLVKAIPEMYLQRFHNCLTNTFTDPLHVMLTYLFTTYGEITPEDLTSQKEKLETKVFDIEQPLILLFNEVEDL